MAKAIVVAAPASGSGKTLITLGLLRALRNRGIRVASAKVGPDYIDPRFHEKATGRPCLNLDPWAMSHALVSALLEISSEDADLVIIEGVMGLFDGPPGGRGSTADLAQLLGLPVLLAIDCRHQAQSIAALVHGFNRYRLGLRMKGVILNRVASPRHEAILREALGERVLAVVGHEAGLELPSRHLGLVQAEEIQQLETIIESVAAALSGTDLLDRVLALAEVPYRAPLAGRTLPPLAQTIAIASDRAFAFAYPHLLQGWLSAGASLSFFSPLNDEVPDDSAEAVFLPGGYPELHAGKLSSSQRFLDGLRRHTGLVYGECGGFMVLGETIIGKDGVPYAMAGLLPLETSFASRKLHLGYRKLTPLGGLPFQQALNGHEFHYSTIAREGEAERLFAAADAIGDPLPPMGLRRGRVMGSYAHVICEAE